VSVLKSHLEFSLCFQVPDGYERKTSIDNGNSFFVNVFTGVRWFSAETESGKIYYYEENGNESCWILPNVSQTIQVRNMLPFQSKETIQKNVQSGF
jgi:hypothetical protein